MLRASGSGSGTSATAPGWQGGPRQIEVSDLGDCFFEAVQVMAGDHLAGMGEEFGWGGREPSVAQMRAAIAGALAGSFEDYRAHLGAARCAGARVLCPPVP